jgi:hypothetical protein
MINFDASAEELNKVGRCSEIVENSFRKPRVGSRRATDWRPAATQNSQGKRGKVDMFEAPILA